MLVGYAFFFALWNNVREHLTPSQELLAALFMMASANVFFWEVFKMIYGILWSQGLETPSVRRQGQENWWRRWCSRGVELWRDQEIYGGQKSPKVLGEEIVRQEYFSPCLR